MAKSTKKSSLFEGIPVVKTSESGKTPISEGKDKAAIQEEKQADSGSTRILEENSNNSDNATIAEAQPTDTEKTEILVEKQGNAQTDNDDEKKPLLDMLIEHEEAPKAQSPSAERRAEVVGNKFSFKRATREKKTVHKGFLITESMNEKWVSLAKSLNMKENQLFENILEQLFEDQGL